MTLDELKQHPFWKFVAPVWEVCGVTDDDLPDTMPDVNFEWFGDPDGNDVWLAENLPKVSAKVEEAAKGMGLTTDKS